MALIYNYHQFHRLMVRRYQTAVGQRFHLKQDLFHIQFTEKLIAPNQLPTDMLAKKEIVTYELERIEKEIRLAEGALSPCKN